MKITNNFNLPEELVTAVRNREYNKGEADYSATGLLQPPQIQVLTGWNYANLVTDVSDSIWSLFGSAVHHILEKAAGQDKQQLAEERLYGVVNMAEQGEADKFVTISGMFDRYEKSLFSIDDYKVTSVWKATKGELKDWTAQLNIYNWLFSQNYSSLPVERLRIHAILRDWSFREAKKSKEIGGDYPLSQVLTIDIPIWHLSQTLNYIEDKIYRLELAKTAKNSFELAQMFPCSVEDRWAKPDSWAVWSPSKNRTQKVFTSDESTPIDACERDARLYAAGMSAPGYKAVLRRGESIRCDNFCLAKDFCAQYKTMTTNEVNSEVLSVEDAVKGLNNE